MSPLIDIQRRMVEAGRIRAGDKGDKGQPQKLVNWRLTSKDQQRLEAAAQLWGGIVQEWTERPGEYELYTETSALPIMLLPGQLPTSWYELWSKGGCQRRCDGHHEIISDSACLCGDERECKPYTRLSVLLPDLPGIGSWLLSSTGWNAASELAGTADVLQRASAQGVLMPARLRLEQRTEIKAGQTRKFSVPVIDIDVSFRDLIASQGVPNPTRLDRTAAELERQHRAAVDRERAGLPDGYTPLAIEANHTSLEQGLVIAETQTATRTRKGTVPIPEPVDEIPFGDEPVPVERETVATQRDILNVLYGTLTRAEAITIEQLYRAVATLRNLDVEMMTGLIEGRKQDGSLSFAKLRDSLTAEERANLIGRLQRLEKNVGV